LKGIGIPNQNMVASYPNQSHRTTADPYNNTTVDGNNIWAHASLIAGLFQTATRTMASAAWS
jgi:hypothetical protein